MITDERTVFTSRPFSIPARVIVLPKRQAEGGGGPGEEVLIQEYFGSVEIGSDSNDVGNPFSGYSGTIAHFNIDLSGDGDDLPDTFTASVSVDGVDITFSGSPTISVSSPTTSISVLADPGQTFTASSDIVFEWTATYAGVPTTDLGDFTLSLFGFV